MVMFKMLYLEVSVHHHRNPCYCLHQLRRHMFLMKEADMGEWELELELESGSELA